MAAIPASTSPAPETLGPPAPHLAQRLRKRVERIEHRAARDDAGAYDDGRELAAIEEGRLWRHGGYRGMNDFLQRGLRRLPASTARQRWQVARHLPRDFVRAQGLLKCYFGLRMVALEAVAPSPAALERLAIDVERGGRMTLVPFALATTNEVRRAAARRRPPVGPLRGLPPGWRARLRPLVQALRPFEAAGARPALSVSTRGRAPERALVRIAVPLDQLAVLYRALGEVLGVRAATGRATGRAIGVAARPPARSGGQLLSGRTPVPRAPRPSARPVARTRPGAKPRADDEQRAAARTRALAPPGACRTRERGRAAPPRAPARSSSAGGVPTSAHSSVASSRTIRGRRRRRFLVPPWLDQRAGPVVATRHAHRAAGRHRRKTAAREH
jgi:hypothetical protein